MSILPSATRRLADFLAAQQGLIEEPLLRRAADALLDTIGCMIFGADLPWSQAAINYALAQGGSGLASVIGTDQSTSPAMAVFANGSSAHAFELDDVHEEAINHPGAVVIPTALALAEDQDASNRDLLEAIVFGYEAMGRAGIAVGPAAHMLAGFHPTSMSGVFGASAAAGRLFGFDGERLNHAFGIAVSLASGTMEFASSGGMAKRIHAGRAAEAGVLAASLAATGFEGADDGLAGRYGFVAVFGPEPRADRLTEALGTRWMIEEITVKPYAACSDIHPLIQAAAELQQQHGLTPEMITKIEAEAPTKAAAQNSMDGTTSVMAAQYSAEFNIAAAILADPRDPATYSPDRINDPSLAGLQAKVVSVRAAQEFDETYAWKMGGRVRIHLTNDEVLVRTVHGQKGSMHDPLSSEELDAKFCALLAGKASTDLAALLRRVPDQLDQPVADLASALRASAPL